ncbi:MAG: tyrosine-type recombinase/integrase, partial [Lachnospiraceae bacterium]|nr:tyrosine-type recombinase/integrase [Lachnospiraceae bacterium]
TILQRFEENNEFPNRHQKVPLVQKTAYSKLHSNFKEIVDYYKGYATQNNHSVNTITKCISKASCFLLHLQRQGHDSLETVAENDVISFFTDDNGVLCRSRSYKRDIESVLVAAEPLNARAKKIRLFLPAIKKRRQNIQYFTQEEALRLRDTLENGATNLTKRDLAIGRLLYFTGLRAGDISSLRLSDIDWQAEVIYLVQSKTGISVEIPMSVGVGNALFEYITEERPDHSDPHVFLWNKPPFTPIDVAVIWPVTAHIYKAAGIRQNSGDRKGSHLFRHHVATHLAMKGFSQPIISEILGHETPESLDYYLSSDIDHLRTCALSIEEFPVAEEVFQV